MAKSKSPGSARKPEPSATAAPLSRAPEPRPSASNGCLDRCPLVPARKIRHQVRIVGRACRYLDHRDAHFGREEVFRIRALVRMAAAPARVLDDQIHLLDAFGPHNGFVFPP